MKNKQRNIKKKNILFVLYGMCNRDTYVLNRNQVKSTSMVHQTIEGESAADVEEIELFSDTGEES